MLWVLLTLMTALVAVGLAVPLLRRYDPARAPRNDTVEVLKAQLGDIDMQAGEGSIAPAVGASEVLSDDKVAKVSIVGIGMRSHAGVASLMFKTLAQENINIQMISTSEIKTSVLIEDKYMELAVRALHKAFGLETAAPTKV